MYKYNIQHMVSFTKLKNILLIAYYTYFNLQD
jgi:hypothetical protein